MKIEDSIPLPDISEIRLECLHRAIQTHGYTESESVVEVAEKYYEFIMGKETVVEPIKTKLDEAPYPYPIVEPIK